MNAPKIDDAPMHRTNARPRICAGDVSANNTGATEYHDAHVMPDMHANNTGTNGGASHSEPFELLTPKKNDHNVAGDASREGQHDFPPNRVIGQIPAQNRPENASE